ncbi:MAG: TonB-dependent receptor [Rhodothalassiaceae bacterium]
MPFLSTGRPFRHHMRAMRLAAGTSALALAASLGSSPVHAQTSADGSVRVLEEITVTARKRSESLQDVPLSIAAQSEAELRNQGALTLEDVARGVAGFTIQNLGPGQNQPAIRGVSAGQIVRDQPGVKEQVGVYLDESVISLSLFTPDIDLFDMNRVEVLRGPQGTLFGSGSIGGTVRYITNKANVDTVEVTAEGSFNAVDGGDAGGELKTAINVPIVDGKLAVRAVGYYSLTPGYIDAVQPDFSVKQDVNDVERYGGRLSLTFQPTDTLTITPRIIYQEVSADGFNRVDLYNILANPFTTTRPPVTLGKRQQFTQLTERFEDDFFLFDNTLEWDIGPVTFTSVTSYTDRDVLVVRDATQLTGSITFQVFGVPEDVFTLDAPLFDATSVEMFTQEARLASNGDGPFQWVAGIFYSDIERLYGQDLVVTGFEDATGIPTAGVQAPKDVLFFSRIPYDFEQIAIFGEASYDITEELTFSAGLRYFDFTERRELNFDGIFADPSVGPGKTTSDGVSPRFILSYDVSEGVSLNAQVAKGFRLGGINDPLNVPLCTPQDLETFGGRESFDNETLWNYEIGAKTSFWNGRGTFNASAFYMDINNLQATLTAGTCSSRIVFNVPNARSIGIEAELDLQPTDNLSFSLAASLTDSELRSTLTSTDANGNVNVLAGIEKGNRLPTVPRFQIAATATWEQPIDDRWNGFVTATVQHVGSRFTQVGDQAAGFGTVNLQAIPIGAPSASTFTFDPLLPSYQLGNLRFGMREDRLEIAAYINNIWDERAEFALDQERGTLARVGVLTNQPRTYGLMVRYSY